MIFSIARKSQLLQNIYVGLSTLVHPAIVHSAGIIEILKKAFWQVSIENLEGAYFEFGVFEGTSMLAAAKIYRQIRSGDEKFLNKSYVRKLYGFDSFEGGFKYAAESDNHPVFREGEYSSSYERCKKRLRSFPEVSLIPGYFEDSLKNGVVPDSEKCAVAFIDCDIKSAAATALAFLRPRLQKGSVVILDDVYSYKADPTQGVQGAWNEFLRANPQIQARPFFSYGCMGGSYIIYAV